MVNADDHSVGVLIDLDIAVRLKDPDSNSPLTIQPVPGGTLPFRAIDVLDQQDDVRTLYYRHDLESFLWTLIWILTYYPFDSSTAVLDLSPWLRGKPSTIANSKRSRLYKMAKGSDLPEGPFKDSWLTKLSALFNNGYLSLRDETADEETMGGIVTYSSFMDILVGNKVGGN